MTAIMTDTDQAVVAAHAEIARLKADLEAARIAHRADIARIGSRLLSAAEEHDLCSAFDRELVDLNRELTVALPLRVRQYRIEITGYLKVPFTHTLTVEVESGGSMSDAAADAMAEISAFDVDMDKYGAEIEDWEVDEYDEE